MAQKIGRLESTDGGRIKQGWLLIATREIPLWKEDQWDGTQKNRRAEWSQLKIWETPNGRSWAERWQPAADEQNGNQP